MNCSACNGPWHPATGHYISEKSRWCGPCTRSHVRWLSGHSKRRWGGLRFYDHATPPPPAQPKRYVFCVDQFTPVEGKPHTSTALTLRSAGVTLEEAYLAVAGGIPEGHRVWCWWEDLE